MYLQEIEPESIIKRNFEQSFKSPATKRRYIYHVKQFMEFVNVDSYSGLLTFYQSQKELENTIIDFILNGKEKKNLSYGELANLVIAIQYFYEMNDVYLAVKKIRKFLGENESIVEDEPYTTEEISLLLQNTADYRIKIAVLLCSSAGLRIGALPYLKKKHLTAVDKYNLYKIDVYANSRKAKYYTFCTPECRKAIDDYLEYRKRHGETITDESYIFRNVINERTILTVPKPIGREVLRTLLTNLVHKSNIFQKGVGQQIGQGKRIRHHKMTTHALRKFFKTQCHRSGLESTISEMLMGHLDKLTRAYLKLPFMEILEGNEKRLGYLSCINNLTINNEHRLQQQMQQVTLERDQIKKMEEAHREELRILQESIERRFRDIASKIDTGKLR